MKSDQELINEYLNKGGKITTVESTKTIYTGPSTEKIEELKTLKDTYEQLKAKDNSYKEKELARKEYLKLFKELYPADSSPFKIKHSYDYFGYKRRIFKNRDVSTFNVTDDTVLDYGD